MGEIKKQMIDEYTYSRPRIMVNILVALLAIAGLITGCFAIFGAVIKTLLH